MERIDILTSSSPGFLELLLRLLDVLWAEVDDEDFGAFAQEGLGYGIADS